MKVNSKMLLGYMKYAILLEKYFITKSAVQMLRKEKKSTIKGPSKTSAHSQPNEFLT